MGKKDFYCAEGCNHDRSKGANCNFYKIPDDPKLRSAWLRPASTKKSRRPLKERNPPAITASKHQKPECIGGAESCATEIMLEETDDREQSPDVSIVDETSTSPNADLNQMKQPNCHDYIRTETDRESFEILEEIQILRTFLISMHY